VIAQPPSERCTSIAAVSLTLDDLAALMGARLSGDGSREAGPLVTDSREAVPGATFFALAGELSDGHNFIQDALARGATALVVDDSWPGEAPEGVAVLRAAGTGEALRRACHARLDQLGCTVVGITGSVGKTTAKELVALTLEGTVEVRRSAGNFNTWTGLPLSVLGISGAPRAFVAEMGMSARGEIADLCTFMRPTVGVLLNVGQAHIGRLGSIEAIAAAKAELLESLPATGLAVLNADDPRVRAVARCTPAPIAWFGLTDRADFRAVDVIARGMAGTAFTLETPQGNVPVELQVPGDHVVADACAAAAVAAHFGLDLATIARRLALFRAPEHRGVLLKGPAGSVIYDDCYNSSPSSLQAALEVLGASGRATRVAVLGDMLELGDHAIAAHRQAGTRAAQAATHLVALGEHASLLIEAAVDAGLPAGNAQQAEDSDAAAEAARALCHADTAVLVKASHGMHLERVVERLAEAVR
jgi:UDP-N-acetylmuramoyl-tripeptide--D-alanyl-D-alanine ligase